MIVETPIDSYKTNIKFNKTIYPQCSCGNCTKFYWNTLFVGARASGKTYSAVSQILHYENNKVLNSDGEQVKIRTFLISPTVEQNGIFKVLKSLDPSDIYDEYTDDILLNIIEDIKAVKQEALDFAEYVKAYRKFAKMKEVDIENLSDEELKLLEENDFEDPRNIEQPRFKVPPVNIVILDDLLGSDCFTNKSKSIFANALIRSRHINCAFQVLTQSLKTIPKKIRLNCNCFWLGKFANTKTILDDLYPEVSALVSESDFKALYLHAIEDNHGSLVVDCTKEKGKWFSKGWNTLLQIKNE